MEKNIYSNPLVERYSSKEMLEIFSPKVNFQLGENYGWLLQKVKKN